MTQQGSILNWVLVVGAAGWLVWTYLLPALPSLEPEVSPAPSPESVVNQGIVYPPTEAPRLPRQPRAGAQPTLPPTTDFSFQPIITQPQPTPSSLASQVSNWFGFQEQTQLSGPLQTQPQTLSVSSPLPSSVALPSLDPASPPTDAFAAQVTLFCQDMRELCLADPDISVDCGQSLCTLCDQC